MYLADVRLRNFRSYRDHEFAFSPGLNVIVGENASGKTNLLEGAYYSLKGASPRTARDDKIVRWGERYTRAEAHLGSGLRTQVFYGLGQGRRLRLNGVDVASADEFRRRFDVFVFVPESLLLVKGSPARRRAHLDAFGASLDITYEAALSELQLALRHRNAELSSIRAGAGEASLDPWDKQLARCGAELGHRRYELVQRLAEPFAEHAAAIAPGHGAFRLRLQSQLEALDWSPEAYLVVLRQQRRADVLRGVSCFGPHRDDLVITEPDARTGVSPTGRDIRLYGSQGEQRAAVLALLLAERQVAAQRGQEVGCLFLDDVMSELDEGRRRRLVTLLMNGGQAIVTTTTKLYFTERELAAATVIELPPLSSEAPAEGDCG